MILITDYYIPIKYNYSEKHRMGFWYEVAAFYTADKMNDILEYCKRDGRTTRDV